MTISLPRYLSILLLLALSTFLLMKVWNNGKQVDSSERDEALDSRIERLQNAEQYALLALTHGYYTCSHCSDGRIWLNKNEVAKYGTSMNTDTRYTKEFLKKYNVYYFTQFTGTLQECLEEEARKIYLYYSLPENAVRFKPLARPPLNKIDR